MKRSVFAAFFATSLLPRCACSDAYGDNALTCIEIEERDFIDADENGIDDNEENAPSFEAGVTGTIVDADFRAFQQSFAICDPDGGELRHAIGIDPGNGAPRVKVSWEQVDTDLSVDFVGEQVTLESATGSWDGNFAFVLRDDEGVALAVSGELGLPSVEDATIEQGGWRGSSVSPCGISSVTGTRITTADATHEVGNGESVDVVVGDNAMRFHAFSTFDFGPVWHCTDTNARLSWALVRRAD